MPIPIASNKYHFPSGYRSLPGASTYLPWNGGLSSLNSPGASRLGYVLDITASGAPADLSTFSFFDFQTETAYLFQFVYNASVPTVGISVLLPNSGASTAAQVSDAIMLAVNAAFGLNVDNEQVYFPWQAQQISPTVVRLNLSTPGAVTISIEPANVDLAITGTGGMQLSSAVPGKVGKLGAFLPGT